MTNPIADPGHGHSPAAWTAVTIMLLAFFAGAIFFIMDMPVAVYVSAGVVLLGWAMGFILAKAGWGEKGPKYQPKAH